MQQKQRLYADYKTLLKR